MKEILIQRRCNPCSLGVSSKAYDYSVMIQKLSKLLRKAVISSLKVIFHKLIVRTESDLNTIF